MLFVVIEELLPYQDDKVGLKEEKTPMKNATKCEFKGKLLINARFH